MLAASYVLVTKSGDGIASDAEGNMWCGQNWLAGSQSGVRKSTGGGLIKFSPNGTALSPAITGFTGMGVDGIGWGTAVALDKVWVASFNGAIGVMISRVARSAKIVREGHRRRFQ
jgi:hypothetical protein